MAIQSVAFEMWVSAFFFAFFAFFVSGGSPISPAVLMGKSACGDFFRPPRFRLTGLQQPHALPFFMFGCVTNALQSPIEIKAGSIVFDNLVVGPWHH